MVRTLVPAFAVLVLAAPSGAIAQDALVASGRTAFQVCAACHGVRPGEKRLGPSLAGVAGRKAASLPGYSYSPALAKAGFVWDDEHLASFIAAPTTAVPGTRMVFRGVPDQTRQKAIIAYLKSLPAR